MPAWTTLKGVVDLNQTPLIDSLAENLAEFFNYGLLEAGGYSDAVVTTPGVADPHDDTTFSPVHLHGVADGTIWQAPQANWVWETGLESSRQPVPSSGVYTNGVFHPTPASGTAFEHYLDYRDGRVVFTHPVATSTVVQASYSYRWINIYDQDTPWFRDVIFDAYRFNDTMPANDTTGSGIIGLLQQNAVHLPAIVVETVGTRTMVPYQQGNTSQVVYQDFLFHVLSETKNDRNAIVDILMAQKDSSIFLFDVDARTAAGQYPLTVTGSPVPGAMAYPALVEPPPAGFRSKIARFNKILGQETSARMPLFRAVVRVTMEVDAAF